RAAILISPAPEACTACIRDTSRLMVWGKLFVSRSWKLPAATSARAHHRLVDRRAALRTVSPAYSSLPETSVAQDPGPDLTPTECRELRRLAGIMLPASAEHGVPGADDAAIFADIVRSPGRDRSAVRQALAELRTIAPGDFTSLDEAAAEEAAM